MLNHELGENIKYRMTSSVTKIAEFLGELTIFRTKGGSRNPLEAGKGFILSAEYEYIIIS